MSYPPPQTPDELPPWPAPTRCICGGITLPASEAEPHPEPLEKNYNHLLSSSPFASRFDTNYAASSEEMPQLRSLIDEQKAEIERTTPRILDLQREILRLCRENDPRRAFVQKHEAFLAPIRHLPVDLLREIFTCCTSSAMPGSMHVDDAPMVLTRVCSSWREVALSTPLLWSSFHVAVPPSLPDPGAPGPIAPRIDGIHEWTSRSGSTPLRVSIYQDDNRLPGSGWRATEEWSEIEGNDADNMQQILNALRPSIPRFKVLNLTCPLKSAQLFFDIPASEWASLREILFFNRTPDFAGLPTDWEANRGHLSLPARGPFYSPNLTMVTLNSVPSSHNPLAYPIPWDCITYLCLSGGAPQAGPMSYLDLFAKISSTIESLDLNVHLTHTPSLDSWPGTGSPAGTHKIITLPHLRTLALREGSPSFKLLAQSIRCPSLEHLKYEEVPVFGVYSPALHGHPGQVMQDVSYDQETPQRSLITLLSHSGTLIKTFGFNQPLYSNEELITIFSFLPLVEKIYRFGSSRSPPTHWDDFYNPTLDPARKTPKDVFLAFVTPQDSPSSNWLPYCPLLRSLTWGRTNPSISEFLEFLELKQSGTLAGVAKLDTVSIHFSSLTEECRQEMLSLFPDPSQVYITHSPSFVPRPAYGSSIRDGLYGQISHWPVDSATDSF